MKKVSDCSSRFIIYLLLSAVLLSGAFFSIPSQAAQAVAFAQKRLYLVTGQRYKVKVNVQGTGETVKFKSSNKKVLTVTGKGVVRAKKPGAVYLTAIMGKQKARCRVRVKDLTVNKESILLFVGESEQLKAKGTNQKVTWKSSDAGIVKVSKKGALTANAAGTANVTAKVGNVTAACRVTVTDSIWERLLERYRTDPNVKQLVFVQYLGGSKAVLKLYVKTDGAWKEDMSCDANVGRNGIDKQREGDKRTPTGVFNLTSGYGIADDPGSKLPYVKVNSYLYWCGDPQWYNQLIDIREHPHTCSGEHLIEYTTAYQYGMFLDYNPDNVYKKGAAIFLHVKSPNPYTSGCIAVDQDRMIYLLRNVEKGAKICIYPQ